MLTKKYRLKKRSSFSYVYRKGETVACAAIKMAYHKSASLKIGFSVSNKLGKATVRNKIKRRMRAAVRSLIGVIGGSWQIIFVAKPAIDGMTFDQIERDIRYLLAKAQILKPQKS